MIEYIKGIVTVKQRTDAVLETIGVGYGLKISLNTYNLLPEIGTEARLLVHEVIREDAHELYGFVEEEERQLFRLLVTVNGLGPNTARIMCSTYAPAELAAHIAGGNDAALMAIKGIGSRIAQRVVVDLKTKVSTELHDLLAGTTSTEGRATTATEEAMNEVCEEAISAFVALGYPASAARKVVAKLAKSNPQMSINEMIKVGLRMF